MRGTLTPQEVPLYRSRAQRFDDLVLDAVAQLEPRWQEELAGVEFAVEEIPAADGGGPEPVPLARLDLAASGSGEARPARIVVYRRPLLARADDDEDLSELVLDVVIEEFARLLGIDPQAVDPGYPEEDE
jgi:predicted Zn-dependent protease with MMP-like domain